MSGGFIPPPDSLDSSASVSASAPNGRDGSHDVKPLLEPKPLLHLTPRQEGKLRLHLDARLAELERDDKTHGFISLPTLLDRLNPILQLILQIPPKEPFSSMRISYLLAFTGSITGYIASLPLITPLAPSSPEAEAEAEAEINMRDTLDFLGRVDRGWTSVLRGEGWVMPLNSRYGKGVRVGFTGQVGQTEKIRLRSIVMTGKSKILAWARAYGTFPGSALPGLGSGGNMSPARPPSLGEWETQVMGMWNGILETLAGQDSADSDDEGEDALD